MKIEACIAKYKENISWVNNLKIPYVIYDKSKDVPNVGRESDTYLQYIIKNYENLPDYVVLLQGNPFDHVKNPNDFIDSINNFSGSTDLLFLHNDYYEVHNKYTRTKESFSALFDHTIPVQFCFSPGAQYIVPKQNILCRPLEFYKTIRDVMVNKNEKIFTHSNCLVCPWTIERIWPYMFNKSIKEKQIKYSDLE